MQTEQFNSSVEIREHIPEKTKSYTYKERRMFSIVIKQITMKLKKQHRSIKVLKTNGYDQLKGEYIGAKILLNKEEAKISNSIVWIN